MQMKSLHAVFFLFTFGVKMLYLLVIEIQAIKKKERDIFEFKTTANINILLWEGFSLAVTCTELYSLKTYADSLPFQRNSSPQAQCKMRYRFCGDRVHS